MEQNPCTVVGEVSKPTDIGLDELNGAVEAFCTGVADSVLAEVEQPLFVAPEHLDDLFDWLQLAAHRVVRPGFEETFGRSLVALTPELTEVLRDASGPTGLEIELVQGAKRDRFSASAIGILLQPCPFAARQSRRASPGQAAVLVLSHRIDCLSKVLGDMELVMHDVGLRHALAGGAHVRQPHVDGHCLDRRALRWRERLQQTHGRFKFLWGTKSSTRSVKIEGIGRGGKPREETLEIRSLNNARGARARKGKAADLGFKPTGICRVE